LYNRIVKKSGAIVLTSQGIFTAKLILSNEKYLIIIEILLKEFYGKKGYKNKKIE
jgi:hypothetical protein